MWLAEVMESLAPPGRDISIASLEDEFPLPSITAGIRVKSLEGEESVVVDVEGCLSFLIHETKV
jgi:hypothetical protein